MFWKYNSVWYILGARIFNSRIKNGFSVVRKAQLISQKPTKGTNTVSQKAQVIILHTRWGTRVPCSRHMCKSRLTKSWGQSLHPQQSSQEQSRFCKLSADHWLCILAGYFLVLNSGITFRIWQVTRRLSGPSRLLSVPGRMLNSVWLIILFLIFLGWWC